MKHDFDAFFVLCLLLLCDGLTGLNAKRQRGKNRFIVSFALISIVNGLNMAIVRQSSKYNGFKTFTCVYVRLKFLKRWEVFRREATCIRETPVPVSVPR